VREKLAVECRRRSVARTRAAKSIAIAINVGRISFGHIDRGTEGRSVLCDTSTLITVRGNNCATNGDRSTK
jgi:hypothetical protein